MSTHTIDVIEFEPIRWPEEPTDYTIENHSIVAASVASTAVEQYWQKMDARPSLLDFEIGVAGH